jgi:CDP-6-deoxy-D-xylo-4-hexulose-3-dehydrase
MKYAFCNEFETRQALSQFILQAPRLSMGAMCEEFEHAFADYHGRKDAILFNSGGSANLAILQALKNLGRLKDNDKVGFSALTWSTNTMPILQMGMQPVAIDCEPKTLNSMSSHLLDRLKTTDLKAFFITNAMGLTGDLDVIRKICDERKIILIEDNCEALGSRLPTGRAGNFGVCSSFSFFVAHHMSTIEGGMVCTDDDDIGEMLRIVRANGWDRNLTAAQQTRWRKKYKVHSEMMAKYTFYDLGFNLRPTEITGFLGLQQLKYLDANILKRQENHEHLEKILKENKDLICLDRSHMSFVSSFAFVVLCKTPKLREHYISQFAGAGVELRPVIAGNMQLQPFYSKYVKEKFDLPGTDFVHECGFYFGNYPELTSADLEVLSSCLMTY